MQSVFIWSFSGLMTAGSARPRPPSPGLAWVQFLAGSKSGSANDWPICLHNHDSLRGACLDCHVDKYLGLLGPNQSEAGVRSLILSRCQISILSFPRTLCNFTCK